MLDLILLFLSLAPPFVLTTSGACVNISSGTATPYMFMIESFLSTDDDPVVSSVKFEDQYPQANYPKQSDDLYS